MGRSAASRPRWVRRTWVTSVALVEVDLDGARPGGNGDRAALPAPGEHDAAVRLELDVAPAAELAGHELEAERAARARLEQRADADPAHELRRVGEHRVHGLGRRADRDLADHLVAHPRSSRSS